MSGSIFVAARQDAARDRRVGTSFWLAADQERAIRKQYLPQVQAFAGRALSEDEFAVRGMLVANTQRDFYYSRFSREALEEAAELLPGAPALYGHDTRGVPVGRIFHARVTRIENPNLETRDQHWLEALYYVPRDAEGEAHLRRVDLGIFREVSISWRCTGQDCSVCGRSINSCPHIPGDIYDRGFCEYEFSGLTSANEVSHVYRGGQKDTATFVPSDPEVAGSGGLAAGRFMRSCPPGSLDIDPALLIEAKRMNGALFARAGHPESLDEWLRSDDGQRAADFLGFSFGQAGYRSNVQRVEVSEGRFTGMHPAKRWARDHDFRVDRAKAANGALVFEQQDLADFDTEGWRDITLDRGIKAVVGKRPERSRRETGRSADGDALSRWFGEGGAST